MTTCKKCKTKFNTADSKCPSCGTFQMPAIMKIVIVLSLVFCGWWAWEESKPKPPPFLTQADIQKQREEVQFQLVVSKLKALKATTKNPASFELVSASLMPSGSVCVTYRGTNSFNAVVTESKAIKTDLTIGNWNKECAGKSGTDMIHAKFAI